jgi:hypothetical protein
MGSVNVKELYQELLRVGKSPKDAAREAQERTGFSLVTGAPIRKSTLKFNKRGYLGQYQ